MSDASVGEDLRRLPHEAALSQRELAAITGVPQPNIAA
jgi:predicted transcriptional regulator